MLGFMSCCDDSVVKFQKSLLSFQLKTKLESKTARFKNIFTNIFSVFRCISAVGPTVTNWFAKGINVVSLKGIS